MVTLYFICYTVISSCCYLELDLPLLMHVTQTIILGNSGAYIILFAIHFNRHVHSRHVLVGFRLYIANTKALLPFVRSCTVHVHV